MTSTTKLPVWFWVIGIGSLLWNLLGVSVYLMQAYGDQAAEGIADRPAWATAAFAIAVFAGLLGCILLLLKKKLAVPVFLVSLIGVLVQQVYNFFIQDHFPIDGVNMIGPIAVLVIAGLLYWYSKGAREKAWLS